MTSTSKQVDVRPPKTMRAADREKLNKELERQRDALRALWEQSTSKQAASAIDTKERTFK